MNTTNPYEKSYFPQSILKGLKFYYELLDKVNIEIYLEEKFPLKRKDIQLTIDFLESMPKEDEINKICHSHPELTWAMESIESFSSLSPSELATNELRILFVLEHLLFSGTNIMFLKAKSEIPKTIKDLALNDKIKYLINNKYHYTQNESSFPSKFIKQVVEYCDSLIKKYKEMKDAGIEDLAKSTSEDEGDEEIGEQE